MTSVARRSGPARHAGAEAYPGPRQAPSAPRPGPVTPSAGETDARSAQEPPRPGRRARLAGGHHRRRPRGHRAVVAQHARRTRARRLADRRGRDPGPALRVRCGRPGRADVAAAAARAGPGHRPAGPLARHGRPVRRQPGGRARPAHRVGLRGHGAHRRGERVGHAAHPVPGRADGDRGRLPAARRRHRLDARRPAAGPLRDVVLPAPVHLPGDCPGVQSPAGRRRVVRRQPGRAVLVVRDVPDGARAGAVVPGRGPASLVPQAPLRGRSG